MEAFKWKFCSSFHWKTSFYQVVSHKFLRQLSFFILALILLALLPTVKPVLKTTFLKRPPVLNDHVVVLP